MFTLAVKRAFLKPFELQCESGSQFLQVDTLGVFEDITMSPEKDKVALVVEGCDLATLKFRHVGEQVSF